VASVQLSRERALPFSHAATHACRVASGRRKKRLFFCHLGLKVKRSSRPPYHKIPRPPPVC